MTRAEMAVERERTVWTVNLGAIRERKWYLVKKEIAYAEAHPMWVYRRPVYFTTRSAAIEDLLRQESDRVSKAKAEYEKALARMKRLRAKYQGDGEK